MQLIFNYIQIMHPKFLHHINLVIMLLNILLDAYYLFLLNYFIFLKIIN